MSNELENPKLHAEKQWDFAYQFLEEFTFDEIGKISVSTDLIVGAMRLMLSMWTDYILVSDPRITHGMSRLVELGIISPSRRDQIMEITNQANQ